MQRLHLYMHRVFSINFFMKTFQQFSLLKKPLNNLMYFIFDANWFPLPTPCYRFKVTEVFDSMTKVR